MASRKTPTAAVAPRSAGRGRLDQIIVLLNTVGSGWILVLVLLINADALGRTFLSRPVAGVTEMVEISIVAIVFLQLPDSIRIGRLMRSVGFLNLLDQRAPQVGRLLRTLFEVLGALFLALILYGSVPLLIESIERGHYVGNIGVFTAPEWPVKLVIVIGGALALAKFAHSANKAWRGRLSSGN